MPYIQISQAAKILEVDKKTLIRWDASGKFPATREKLSGNRYYDEKEILKLALWFQIRRKDKAHNRKLAAIMKVVNQFSGSMLLPHARDPLHNDRSQMKEAYTALQTWVEEHKKISREYSKLPRGFIGKVDPES